MSEPIIIEADAVPTEVPKAATQAVYFSVHRYQEGPWWPGVVGASIDEIRQSYLHCWQGVIEVRVFTVRLPNLGKV